LTKAHLVPAVGLEAKADIFAVVHEWHQWPVNKGEYVGFILWLPLEQSEYRRI
jgi:hypothetical protein